MAAVLQERALQGRMSVAFGICKNALRMERQARQHVTAKPAMVPGSETQLIFCSCLQCFWLLWLHPTVRAVVTTTIFWYVYKWWQFTSCGPNMVLLHSFHTVFVRAWLLFLSHGIIVTSKTVILAGWCVQSRYTVCRRSQRWQKHSIQGWSARSRPWYCRAALPGWVTNDAESHSWSHSRFVFLHIDTQHGDIG